MDIQPNLLTTLGGYISFMWDWTVSHWFELVVAVLLMLGLWAMVSGIKAIRNRKHRRFLKMRAERMSPEEKARHIKKIVGDGIHDALFEAWVNGEISGDDYSRECRRFGNIFDLSDLLPKQQKLLKTRLKERIKQLRASEKPVIPGPPEPKKAEVVTTEAKANSFLGSFLGWRKNAQPTDKAA